MLAQRIAQLDHMARGRFYFGIGSGGFPGDFELFKVDPKEGEHRGLTTDMIELVLKLWDDPSPGDYDHKFWQFTVPEPREEIGLWLHMKPYQQPHPPIAVAGVSPKSETLLMAGERGWMPMSINIVPSRILASHWDAVAEGAQRVGRVADRSTWRVARDVYVAESTEQARREVLEGVVARDWNGYFFPLLKYSRLLEILKVDPEMPDDDLNVEYMLDNIWIVGDPDEVARQVRQLYRGPRRIRRAAAHGARMVPTRPVGTLHEPVRQRGHAPTTRPLSAANWQESIHRVLALPPGGYAKVSARGNPGTLSVNSVLSVANQTQFTVPLTPPAAARSRDHRARGRHKSAG